MSYTINIKGRLLDLSTPQVMGILNVTPDSFYAGSRVQTEDEIVRRCHQIVDEGASMIDVGGYSTRPGGTEVSEAEEMERLRFGLGIIRRELPDAIISVDTFRTDVARMAVEEFGADIINDVSEGNETMYRMVSRLRVPYILMSTQPTLKQMLMSFAHQVQQLRDFGACDIILDPGFGFSKTMAQNYELMAHLEDFQVFELPLLVGVSRKSMIWRLLDIRPEEALNGTTALHMAALERGADILRVHDVKPAVEAVRIYEEITKYQPTK